MYGGSAEVIIDIQVKYLGCVSKAGVISWFVAKFGDQWENWNFTVAIDLKKAPKRNWKFLYYTLNGNSLAWKAPLNAERRWF